MNNFISMTFFLSYSTQQYYHSIFIYEECINNIDLIQQQKRNHKMEFNVMII